MDKIKVIVIEDEASVRTQLVERLKEEPSMMVVGAAASVKSAIMTIEENNADLLFLDISIKGGDAFMLINRLLKEQIRIPPILLNTGHTEIEYAQKAFNEYQNFIIHIWKKPFYENWDDRIAELKYLLKKRIFSSDVTIHKSFKPQSEKYAIKSGGDIIVLSYEEILYVDASGDVSQQRKSLIHCFASGPYLVSKTLRQVNEDLSAHGFLQINRNQIINIRHIQRFNAQEQCLYLERQSKAFAVGSTYLSKLKNFLEGWM